MIKCFLNHIVGSVDKVLKAFLIFLQAYYFIFLHLDLLLEVKGFLPLALIHLLQEVHLTFGHPHALLITWVLNINRMSRLRVWRHPMLDLSHQTLLLWLVQLLGRMGN